jgi:hypothetical protein
MHSTGLECLGQSWNDLDRVGIPLNRVRMLCTGLVCFLRGCNAFYSFGMHSTGLECFLQGWNALYRVEMLSTELEYFRQSWSTFLQSWNTFLQSWNNFLQSWNAFYRVGMIWTVLEYL